MMALFKSDIESYFEVTSSGTYFFPNKDKRQAVKLEHPEQQAMLRSAIANKFTYTRLAPVLSLLSWMIVCVLIWLEWNMWTSDRKVAFQFFIAFILHTILIIGFIGWMRFDHRKTVAGILNYHPPMQHFGLPDE